MKYKRLIFIITAFLIFIFGLIAHLQYFDTKRNIIELYSEKQMTLARQASVTLEAFIEDRIHAIEVLADMPVSRNLDRQKFLTEYQRTFERVSGFEFIVFVDKRGKPQVGYPTEFPCISEQPMDVQNKFSEAFETAKRERTTVIFSKNVQVRDKVFVCLIAPIYSFLHEFQGAILGILHVNDALEEALTPIYKEESEYVWVLNDAGYLLYHPGHEDMLLKNVLKSESGCESCHHKFDFEERMLRTEIGVGIKQNRGSPKVLIGYARVPLQTTSWIVAVSSPFSSVVVSIRNQFFSFLLLVIFMMMVIITSAVLMSRINKKLMLAQLERDRERQKHLALIGEMAARIAHEIKNPLASIQTGIQFLESHLRNDDKQKGYYERLRNEIQRVDRILKGLLTYAREDRLDARLVEIPMLIKRFESLIAPTIEKQGLQLESHLGNNLPMVQIDEHKIEQVLWNVMLNAIQASEPGGKIHLEAVPYDGGIEMRVRDQGSGIPETDLEKIFTPFYSTKPHGSGLGLAISKKIIEMHQGKITIESKSGQGTTVIIHLPEGEKKS